MQTLGLSPSTPKPASRFKDLFNPDLSSLPGAQTVCESAAMACFFIAGLTAVVSFFINLAMLADAVLFLLIALGLRKYWRTAAVAGFVLFLIEQGVNISQGQIPGVMAILFVVILFNGIRASFAYRRMLRESQTQPASAESAGA